MFPTIENHKSDNTVAQKEEVFTLADLMASSTLVVNAHIVASQAIADWLVSGRVGDVEVVFFQTPPSDNIRMAYAEYEAVYSGERLGFRPDNTPEDAESLGKVAMGRAFAAFSAIITEERDCWKLWPRERKRTIKQVYRLLRGVVCSDAEASRALRDIWQGTKIVFSNEAVNVCLFEFFVDLVRTGKWDRKCALAHLRKRLPRRKFDWAFGMHVGIFQEYAIAALDKYKRELESGAFGVPHQADIGACHSTSSASREC